MCVKFPIIIMHNLIIQVQELLEGAAFDPILQTLTEDIAEDLSILL